MANELFNKFGNQNNFMNIANSVKEFAKTIQGDPKSMVEQLLASGQMSQAQFNQYSQMAQQILPFMK